MGKDFSVSYSLCKRPWDKLLFFWSHIDTNFQNHQRYLRTDILLVKYWPLSQFRKIRFSIKLAVRKKCGGMFRAAKCFSIHMLISSIDQKTILNVWKSKIFPSFYPGQMLIKMLPIGIISGLFWISQKSLLIRDPKP